MLPLKSLKFQRSKSDFQRSEGRRGVQKSPFFVKENEGFV